MGLSALLLHPPGRTVYHARGRAEWPSYPENPDRPGTAIRVGEERHWTRCGLLAFDSALGPRQTRMDAMRPDNAALVGRPCRRCYR